MVDRHDGAHYQQRIWKVSMQLDRLALMCEQHHLQTKHIDGLPDWIVPKSAAGVAPPDRVSIPAYFAWHDTPPSTPVAEREGGHDDGNRGLEANMLDTKATTAMSKRELDLLETDRHEQATEELRASTSDLLSRLAPPSLSSSVSSTSSTSPRIANLPSQYSLPKRLIDSRSSTRSNTETTQSSYTGGRAHGSLSSGSHTREAGEPHRRRKVQFADHGRSYRGDRSTRRVSDLTYHEALQAVAPCPSRAANGGHKAEIRTTYQETFQWPSRETLVTLMDRVGGQTAGGEARYEPRRVFTAEDAIHVAQESAYDLLKQRVRGKTADELPKDSIAREPVKKTRNEEEEVVTTVDGPLLPQDTPVQPVTQSSSESKQPPEHVRKPKPRSKIEKTIRSTELKISPPERVEASTQTDAPKRAVMPSTRVTTPPSMPPHSGFCSHCGRSGVHADPKSEVASCTRKAIHKDAVRAVRSIPQRYRPNPIFANTRYPSEPPQFRFKSTYATEFGKLRGAKRY